MKMSCGRRAGSARKEMYDECCETTMREHEVIMCLVCSFVEWWC